KDRHRDSFYDSGSGDHRHVGEEFIVDGLKRAFRNLAAILPPVPDRVRKIFGGLCNDLCFLGHGHTRDSRVQKEAEPDKKSAADLSETRAHRAHSDLGDRGKRYHTPFPASKISTVASAVRSDRRLPSRFTFPIMPISPC